MSRKGLLSLSIEGLEVRDYLVTKVDGFHISYIKFNLGGYNYVQLILKFLSTHYLTDTEYFHKFVHFKE